MQPSTHLERLFTKHAIEAESHLGELLGWTEMVKITDSFLGKPPDGEPSCRGQAQLPRWCRDWTATGPLIAQFGIDFCDDHEGQMVSTYCTGDVQRLAHDVNAFPSKDHTVRYAIVIAAIAHLELKFASRGNPVATPFVVKNAELAAQ